MKIIVIGPVHPYRGGIAHFTSQLSQSLRFCGHEVHNFSFVRQYPGWLYPGKSDKEPSQTAFRLDANFTLDPLKPWTWTKTANKITELNPDAILINWWTTFWAPAFWVLSRILNKKGQKIIFIIHNVIPHEPQPWDKWIARNVLRLGDGHLVQASNEKDRLLALIPDAQSTLCPMPEFDMFSPQEAISKYDAKRRLGIEEDIPILLFFGIIRPYKGLKYAIEAVSILRDKGTNVHLLVAGEFWEKINVYKDQISQLRLSGNVTLVDQYIPNDEVANYFSATDVFIAPYIEGTQSASVKIAMSFDLPIVMTESITDDILLKSEMVSIIPSKDSYELAESINHFIANRQKGGKYTHQEKGGWIRQVQAIENLVKPGENNFKHSNRK